MNKVAVQVLFGQNKEPFLEAALKSVMWADYFVACNTAPTHTVGIENEDIFQETLKDKENKVCTLYPDQRMHFSFASARNKTLEHISEGDYVLILDADDVHFPEFEGIVRDAIANGVSNLTAHFYHLMVYKDLYQYVQPREILYKMTPHTYWASGVHEQLITLRPWPRTVSYHYMHYGYIKSQHEVFNRWKFYSDLEGDFNHYSGQNPDHILDDRISVSKTLPTDHPDCVKEVLKDYPVYSNIKINKETGPYEKAGLIMIVKKGDLGLLNQNLHTLYNTIAFPNFEIQYIVEEGAHKELELLQQYAYAPSTREADQISIMEPDTSLTEALNYGLEEFRVRHDIQYIGWIHPDMRFDDINWLSALWQTLQDFPKIGKICAANTRDNIPSKLTEGHEQCYLIRKDIVNKVGLFDEGFIGIGGYEDWDYNRRIMNHNDYRVMITPTSRVYHQGMATRKKRDTTDEQIRNANYYYRKWNTHECPV